MLSHLGGFQVSRKEVEEKGKRESARGYKSKGNAPCIVVHYNLCLCTMGAKSIVAIFF
jgi:hypothetical protein